MRENRARGTTLVELMIVMALFGLLLVGLFTFIDSSIALYRESRDALEIRQQGLLGLTVMSNELRESAKSSIEVQDSPTSGVVFTSNLDSTGVPQYETNSARISWQKFVSFYLAPAPNGTNQLLRKEESFTPESSFVPNSLGQSPPRDVLYFLNNTSLSTNLICRQVETLELTKDTDLLSVRMVMKLEGRREHSIELQTRIKPRK